MIGRACYEWGVKQLLVAFLASAALMTFETQARAVGGTCECYADVCTAGGAACVKSTACEVGYAPVCRARLPDPGVCSALVCTGVCDCAQIPGFCETTGGADYCDAGVDTGPFDTGAGDTSVLDTGASDTGSDTRDATLGDTSLGDGTTGDTSIGDTSTGDTSTGDTKIDTLLDSSATDSRADTGGADSGGDSAVGDTGGGDSGGDTGSGDTGGDTSAGDSATGDGTAIDGDSCVPKMCPAGTHTTAIPGECNPYCAQPCGMGEFKCSALPGTECKDGFCIPVCLLTGCGACLRCNVGDGKCVDDPAKCDGGISDADAGSDTFLDFDTGTPDATFADARDPFLDPDFDPYGTQGGCGCDVPGSTDDHAALAAAAVALTCVLMTRRRSRR